MEVQSLILSALLTQGTNFFVTSASGYLSSVKMNLQGRNNLSTSKHLQGPLPCEFFILWVYGIRDCLFCNNSNDNRKFILIKQGRFFSRQGNNFADE